MRGRIRPVTVRSGTEWWEHSVYTEHHADFAAKDGDGRIPTPGSTAPVPVDMGPQWQTDRLPLTAEPDASNSRTPEKANGSEYGGSASPRCRRETDMTGRGRLADPPHVKFALRSNENLDPLKVDRTTGACLACFVKRNSSPGAAGGKDPADNPKAILSALPLAVSQAMPCLGAGSPWFTPTGQGF